MSEEAPEHLADDEGPREPLELEFRPPPPQDMLLPEAETHHEEPEGALMDVERFQPDKLKKPLVVYLLGDSGFSLALMTIRIAKELANANTLFKLVSTILEEEASVIAVKTYIYTGRFPGAGPLYAMQLGNTSTVYFASDSQADAQIIGANVEHYKNIFIGLRTVLDDITGCRWSRNAHNAPLRGAAKCILGSPGPIHGALEAKPHSGSTVILTAMGGTGASRSLYLLRNILENERVRRATRITLAPIFPPASTVLTLRKALEAASSTVEGPTPPGASIEYYNEYINMYVYLHVVKNIVEKGCGNKCMLRFMPIEQAPPSSYWALKRISNDLLQLNPYINPDQYTRLGLKKIVESIQAIEVRSTRPNPSGQWGLPGRASSFSIASFLALACSLMLQENDQQDIAGAALVSCSLVSIDKRSMTPNITLGAPLLHEALRGTRPVRRLPITVPRDVELDSEFMNAGYIGLAQIFGSKHWKRDIGVSNDNTVYVFVYEYYRFEDAIRKYIEHLEKLYDISSDNDRRNIFNSFFEIAKKSYSVICNQIFSRSQGSPPNFCTDEYRSLLEYTTNNMVNCN